MTDQFETDFRNLVAHRVDRHRSSPAFLNYMRVRDSIYNMMDDWARLGTEEGPSSYWEEEIEGFIHLFDASPLIVEKLREQCYHITGIKSYEYRAHHAHLSNDFAQKLALLRAVDRSHLFVPEPPDLGGFGFDVGPGLVNIDTLKYYEVLIGLDKSGVLANFHAGGRHTVLEIGSGWGGFAYQFKTLFPKTTYICVDLPPTMLFSGVYLTTLFPQARSLIYGEPGFDEKVKRITSYDFVLLPHFYFDSLQCNVDLGVNMVSFQEMTSEQVSSYANGLKRCGTPYLYSLNRDRSRYNEQLSTVSEILKEYFHVNLVPVLDLQYNQLKPLKGPKRDLGVQDYRHYLASSSI